MYYVEVDECYMKLGRMTRCKVKVTDVRKLRKWSISKSPKSNLLLRRDASKD